MRLVTERCLATQKTAVSNALTQPQANHEHKGSAWLDVLVSLTEDDDCPKELAGIAKDLNHSNFIAALTEDSRGSVQNRRHAESDQTRKSGRQITGGSPMGSDSLVNDSDDSADHSQWQHMNPDDKSARHSIRSIYTSDVLFIVSDLITMFEDLSFYDGSIDK